MTPLQALAELVAAQDAVNETPNDFGHMKRRNEALTRLIEARKAARAVLAQGEGWVMVPKDAVDSLERLWPFIEKATKGCVFTAQKAGEVAADMQTVRAMIAAAPKDPHT